jgi:Fe-S cluster assembly iron-binding protein IscA
MALDEPNEKDLTFANEGYTLVIERELIEAFGGVSVDYVESSMGVGFDLRVTSGDRGGCDSGSCGSGCH